MAIEISETKEERHCWRIKESKRRRKKEVAAAKILWRKKMILAFTAYPLRLPLHLPLRCLQRKQQRGNGGSIKRINGEAASANERKSKKKKKAANNDNRRNGSGVAMSSGVSAAAANEICVKAKSKRSELY